MVLAGPRVRVVMDMGMKLAMVKVWRLQSGPMGMWVVMAGPMVRVVMYMEMELAMMKVWRL